MKTQIIGTIAYIILLGVVWSPFQQAHASEYSDTVLGDNPVGYWRLGETNGTTAIDQTANANNGTYQGSVVLGQPGAIVFDTDTAVDFDTALSLVRVPHDAVLDLAGQGMTLEAWVTLDSLAAYRTIIMKTTNAAWQDGYGFYTLPGDLRLFVDSFGVNAVTAFPASPIYRHLVGTYDGSLLKIYVNSALVGTLPYAVGIDSSAGDLLIGEGAPGSGAYTWDGLIDEVAVYNYALSPAQILGHYQVGALIPEPTAMALLGLGGIVLLWRFRRE